MDWDAVDLPAQLEDAQRRVALAEYRLAELQMELVRLRAWQRASLIAVVAVALVAILMLGVVAFNAVDDREPEATSVVG